MWKLVKKVELPSWTLEIPAFTGLTYGGRKQLGMLNRYCSLSSKPGMARAKQIISCADMCRVGCELCILRSTAKSESEAYEIVACLL